MINPYIKRCVISPPFGNYFSHPDATRIRGSYTLERRKGLIWNTIKSFRKVEGGWVNKIGLRNCGVASAPTDGDSIYSLSAIQPDDWAHIYDRLHSEISMIEINLGCPNLDDTTIAPSKGMFDLLHMLFKVVIVKIAPTDHGFAQGRRLVEECGVSILHCCNTVPSDRGGISGTQLKPISLDFVEKFRQLYPELTIIGGGGIYTHFDIVEYDNAGADHFSLSTAFMKPWKAKEIITFVRSWEEPFEML